MDTLTNLSKTISHALRHEPWLYELEMDDEGWVRVEMLLSALRTQNDEWENIEKTDLLTLVDLSDKKRFEIDGNHIRALYGHSLPGRLQKNDGVPPDVLYHGTAHKTVDIIMNNGLLPMKRQYVHLSTDIETAQKVGKRKDHNPIILTIYAKHAYDNGVHFYIGNELVWLADKIPPEFIQETNKLIP